MKKANRAAAALKPRLITAALLNEALSRVTGSDDLKRAKNASEALLGTTGYDQ